MGRVITNSTGDQKGLRLIAGEKVKAVPRRLVLYADNATGHLYLIRPDGTRIDLESTTPTSGPQSATVSYTMNGTINNGLAGYNNVLAPTIGSRITQIQVFNNQDNLLLPNDATVTFQFVLNNGNPANNIVLTTPYTLADLNSAGLINNSPVLLVVKVPVGYTLKMLVAGGNITAGNMYVVVTSYLPFT